MKVREFPLPKEFKCKINKNDYKDYQILKNQLLIAFKEYMKGKYLLDKNPIIINFRKYCIVQYIKFLDQIRFSRKKKLDYVVDSEQIEIFYESTKDIKHGIRQFVYKCMDNRYKFTDRALNTSLKYLVYGQFLFIEDLRDCRNKLYKSYTCEIRDQRPLTLIRNNIEEFYDTERFVLKPKKGTKKYISTIINKILYNYPYDIIAIYDTKIPLPINYDDKQKGTPYIVILCFKDSKFYKDCKEMINNNL